MKKLMAALALAFATAAPATANDLTVFDDAFIRQFRDVVNAGAVTRVKCANDTISQLPDRCLASVEAAGHGGVYFYVYVKFAPEFWLCREEANCSSSNNGGTLGPSMGDGLLEFDRDSSPGDAQPPALNQRLFNVFEAASRTGANPVARCAKDECWLNIAVKDGDEWSAVLFSVSSLRGVSYSVANDCDARLAAMDVHLEALDHQQQEWFAWAKSFPNLEAAGATVHRELLNKAVALRDKAVAIIAAFKDLESAHVCRPGDPATKAWIEQSIAQMDGSIAGMRKLLAAEEARGG